MNLRTCFTSISYIFVLLITSSCTLGIRGASDSTSSSTSSSSGDTLVDPTSLWSVNGPVTSLDRSGNTLYIGGNFSKLGPNTGYGAAIDTTTAVRPTAFKSDTLKVDGVVRTSIADGSGGFYIGGDFSKVGSVTRNLIAHISADGTLDSGFNPDITGTSVVSLLLNGTNLYIGGAFTHIGGTARSNLGMISTTDGSLSTWDPSVDNTVNTMVYSANILYIGGSFSNVGADARQSIAAVDADPLSGSYGQATAFNANYTGTNSIESIAISSDGNYIYAGGYFQSALDTIGGAAREGLVELDLSGAATAWDSSIIGVPRALAVSGTTLYVGGEFTAPLNYGYAVDIDHLSGTYGSTLTWNPDTNFSIHSIAVNGTTIYIGGDFTTVSTTSTPATRNNIAEVDAVTGVATSWDPDANGKVYALAISGSKIYAGGAFTSITEQVTRNKLAAIDLTTGEPTSWNPDITGTQVASVKAYNSTIYVGGTFTAVGAIPRNNLAAIDATTGIATAWAPEPDLMAKTLTISGDTLYVGGQFTTIDGNPFTRIAKFDLTTGNIDTGWHPDADTGVVNSIEVSGTTIYVGGTFNNIGGAARARIAAVDSTTGTATAWNPNINGVSINSIVVDGNTIYVGGNFMQIEGIGVRYLGSLNADGDGAANPYITAWNPGVTSQVTKLALSGTTLYVGGIFTMAGGSARNKAAAFNVSTGALTTWNPRANDAGLVAAIIPTATKVILGGTFTTLGGSTANRLGVVDDELGLQ